MTPTLVIPAKAYVALRKMKKSKQVLMMGPWVHGGFELSYAGDLDFGTEAHIQYYDSLLAWFDHYLKGMHTEVADWSPVQIFTMGTGDGGHVVRGAPGALSEYPGRISHGGYWERRARLAATGYQPHPLLSGGRRVTGPHEAQ